MHLFILNLIEEIKLDVSCIILILDNTDSQSTFYK